MSQETYTLETFSSMFTCIEPMKNQVEFKISKRQPERIVIKKAMIEILGIVCCNMELEDIQSYLQENYGEQVTIQTNDPQSAERQCNSFSMLTIIAEEVNRAIGNGNAVGLQQVLDKVEDQMMSFEKLSAKVQEYSTLQEKNAQQILNQIKSKLNRIEYLCNQAQNDMPKLGNANDMMDSQSINSQENDNNFDLRLDRQCSKSEKGDYYINNLHKHPQISSQKENLHSEKKKKQLLDDQEERKSASSMKLQQTTSRENDEGWIFSVGINHIKGGSSSNLNSGVLESLIGNGINPTVILSNKGNIVNTLIPLTNGGYVAGGYELVINTYNKENQFSESIDIQKGLSSGFMIKDFLICGLRKKGIQIFNPTTLKEQQYVQTNGSVKKLIKQDESHMILAEKGCFLEILNFFKQKLVYHSYTVDCGEVIYDIQKTTEKDEYVLACGSKQKHHDNGGLVFIKLDRIDGKFFKFNYDPIKDVFYNQSNCVGVVQISQNVFYICIQGKDKIRVFDRSKKTNVNCINNISGSKYYNSIQKAINYHEVKFPYVFVKDDKCLSVINTKTQAMKIICNSTFEVCGKGQSLMQIQSGKNLKLVTLDYDILRNIRTMKQIIFQNVCV